MPILGIVDVEDVALHVDLAFDARDRVAADPDILANTGDMDATGSPKGGALTRYVAIRRNSGADKPLCKAGIETSRDRILS